MMGAEAKGGIMLSRSAKVDETGIAKRGNGVTWWVISTCSKKIKSHEVKTTKRKEKEREEVGRSKTGEPSKDVLF